MTLIDGGSIKRPTNRKWDISPPHSPSTAASSAKHTEPKYAGN